MKTTAIFALLIVAAAARADNIHVTGDAEVKVEPDQVVIALGVEVHAKTLAEARRQNDSRVSAVLGAAAALGVEKKDIQTDFIQMGMAYESDEVTPRYYYTRKSIVITLHDIRRMEQVIAATVDAGATHIHSVDFQTTELRKYRDRARALAVEAATEKARDMAAAAGMKVVGGAVSISSANYGGGSWYGGGWYGRYAAQFQNVSVSAGGSSSGGPQGTIALGRISVTATVAMEFRLE